jgi:hypothetical protein
VSFVVAHTQRGPLNRYLLLNSAHAFVGRLSSPALPFERAILDVLRCHLRLSTRSFSTPPSTPGMPPGSIRTHTYCIQSTYILHTIYWLRRPTITPAVCVLLQSLACRSQAGNCPPFLSASATQRCFRQRPRVPPAGARHPSETPPKPVEPQLSSTIVTDNVSK